MICYDGEMLLYMQMSYQPVGGGIVQYSLSANPEYVSCKKRVVVNKSGVCHPAECVSSTHFYLVL